MSALPAPSQHGGDEANAVKRRALVRVFNRYASVVGGARSLTKQDLHAALAELGFFSIYPRNQSDALISRLLAAMGGAPVKLDSFVHVMAHSTSARPAAGGGHAGACVGDGGGGHGRLRCDARRLGAEDGAVPGGATRAADGGGGGGAGAAARHEEPADAPAAPAAVRAACARAAGACVGGRRVARTHGARRARDGAVRRRAGAARGRLCGAPVDGRRLRRPLRARREHLRRLHRGRRPRGARVPQLTRPDVAGRGGRTQRGAAEDHPRGGVRAAGCDEPADHVRPLAVAPHGAHQGGPANRL
eukprot:Rhum_TRINITY_DN14688_c5_g1::Rhum_TRINITY_DN14688_c5_g1_i2::g.108915::m.108915